MVGPNGQVRQNILIIVVLLNYTFIGTRKTLEGTLMSVICQFIVGAVIIYLGNPSKIKLIFFELINNLLINLLINR